jgi:hypothetical protein
MGKNFIVSEDDKTFVLMTDNISALIKYILNIKFSEKGYDIKDKYIAILYHTFLSMKESDFTEKEIKQISNTTLIQMKGYYEYCLENKDKGE